MFATIRLAKFFYILVFGRVDGALIFAQCSTTSMLEKGGMCLLARLLGKHVVLSIRSRPVLPRSRFAALFIRFTSLVFSACKVVIVQSEFAKNELLGSFVISSEKITIIPNWIDNNRFQHFPKAVGEPSAFISLFMLVGCIR